MIGVNLAGAEFGKGTRYGYDYIYPNAVELDYFSGQGVELIRLPFRWERVQPGLGGGLDPAEVARIHSFLDAAAARGMSVILDVHNYGRYAGGVIGSADVPIVDFADFWAKMAVEFQDEPAIYGFGLMNEPHNMGGKDVWKNAAQAAVDAIRATGATEDIYVSGDGWGGAHSWLSINSNLIINDPLDGIVYEAHLYFDQWNTGVYDSYEDEHAYPDVGVDKLQPFLTWLEENNLKGFIGEFGVPNTDPRWLQVLGNFVDALHESGIDGTAWAAGPWWGNYPLSLEPQNGVDKPQIDVLTRYITVDALTTEDGAAFSVNLLENARDPSDPSLAIEDLILVSGDARGVSAHANALVVDPSAYNHLGDGETSVVKFRYGLVEGAGAESTQIATVIIEGVNDAPVVGDPIQSAAPELGDVFVVDLLLGASDPEGETLSVRNLTLLSGDDRGVSVDGSSLSIDPSSYQPGQVLLRFSYEIVDESSGSTQQTINITIGNDDLPLIDDASPTQGQLLSAETLPGGPGADDVQWQAFVGSVWTSIAGATGQTFVPTGAQVGHLLRVVQYLSNGTQTWQVASEQTLIVGNTFAGSAGADVFSGNAGDDWAAGLGGDDLLRGESGDDRLDGGAGRNVLFGGEGSDVLVGGTGIDGYDGGAGYDTVTYAAAGSAITINLLYLHCSIGDAVGDTFAGVEHFFGSQHSDNLLGDNGNNSFSGLGGDDSFIGRAGADSFDGGSGFDTVSYSTAAPGLTVNMLYQALGTGDAAGDTYLSIERIFGSQHNDNLVGDNGNNSFSGLGGDDSFIGRAGADSFNGGTGTDTVSYTTAGAGVKVDFIVAGNNEGDALGDTFVLIENIIGSSHNDTLAGNKDANVLYGRDGNDILRGRGGADVVVGGAGADTFLIQPGTESDTVADHRTGVDTIRLLSFSGIQNLGDLRAAGTDVGADSTYDLGGGDTLIILGHHIADLQQDDFLFS